MEDEETRSGYLKEITGAISIYDATYNTGCRPLDYVLREKSLLFNEYQVEFSCMAEGECIDFMTAADVYALFGNALDNALECVQEEKKRGRAVYQPSSYKTGRDGERACGEPLQPGSPVSGRAPGYP